MSFVFRFAVAAMLSMIARVALACVAYSPDTVFANDFEQCGGLPAGSTVSILWVGNSLTDTPPDFQDYSQGPLPVRLAPMLAELGITMTWQAAIQGGAEFSDHAANPATMALISDPRFDIVNMQGYYHYFDAPAHFLSAVQPLYNAAHGAGSVALFEAMWPYLGDPGSPQFPASPQSVEGAAASAAGSFPVQIARAWERIKETDSTLHTKLRADNTHQSAVGEYLNCLVYTRFLSGKSVQSIVSISPQAAARISDTEKQELKDAVDQTVNMFYIPSGQVLPDLAVAQPTNGEIYQAGASVTFSASASDPDGGDLSSNIHWTDAGGNLLGVGATFVLTPPVGQYTVTATVTGDGGTATAARAYSVVSGPNQAPVAVDKTQDIPHGSPFTQINLSGSATDVDGTIDWTTLQLELEDFDGVSAVQDTLAPPTVDVDYSNGYTGQDTIRWRVADNLHAYSNWAHIYLNVQAGTAPRAPTVPAAPAKGKLRSPVKPEP
jgi:hypothetical protein